tara:strand:- start:9992 stop:17002 length:7011 start_codon:yes stop_codon:yes gene_type:complete
MTIGTFEKQRAIIYDLIAAGEIQGVVGGLGGVYLNDTAIVDGGTMQEFQPLQGIVTVSGTSVTNATAVGGGNLFAGLSTSELVANPRYIQIKGAGKTSTLASNMNVNSNVLISSANSMFTTSMIQPIDEDDSSGPGNGYDAPVAFLVRIPGASATGGVYQGILINVGNSGSGSGNRATLSPPIGKAVSAGTTFEIDYVAKITAINSANSCTIASAATRSATAVSAKVSGAVHSSGSLSSGRSKRNYESASVSFYRGTRNQPAHTAPGSTAAATYTLGPNFDLKWHTSQDSSGGQSTYFITGDSFSMSQNSKQETDRVKINLEFPGGLSFTSESGNKHTAYAEFQITLEYKSDASDSDFTKELMIGRNYGGTDFISSVPAWNQLMETQRDVLYGGSGTRSSNGVISKKNQKVAFIKEYDIDLKPFQPMADWRIGIKRLSPDSSKDYTFEKHTVVAPTRVKTVEAIIEERLSYPMSAYSVVQFSAEDFSSIPKRAYHIRGKKIKVPSNYLTREELGSSQAKYTRNKTSGVDTNSYVTWDGTFRGDVGSSHVANRSKVYTNNPAWIFYDILTDKEIGLGNFIKESDIDHFSLYQIARHCDELVPNERGGLEPRFACNVYLARQEDAYKVLKDLSSTFRSMMYWIDGQIVQVQDVFKEPVYTFSNGNVKDGLFEYTFTGQRSRVNQVNVTWSNPEELFKQTVLTIDDTANILEQKKVISKDVVAFGCTSEGQAKRLGKWHMLTDTQETELVSFTTGINASFLRPGDHINVQDHYADSIIASGRVSSASNTTSIVLDRDVAVTGYDHGSGTAADASHILYLIYPDSGTYLNQAEQVVINSVTYKRGSLILGDASGNPITSEAAAANLVDDSGNSVVAQFSSNTRIEKVKIGNTSAGTGNVTLPAALTVYLGLTSVPNSEVIWAIGPELELENSDIKQFRVLAIDEEKEAASYKISAGLVATDKYEELEVSRPVYIPDYSSFSGAATEVPPPTNLSLELVSASSTSIDGAEQGFDAIIGWTPPEITITDTNSNARVVPYEFINRYEITHDLSDGPLEGGFSQIEVGAGTQNIRIPNASAGTFSIRIRTISDTGAKSVYETATRSITAPPPNFNRITNIPLGGTLTTSVEFDSGSEKIIFEENTYTYITPAGFNFPVTSGNTNFTEQAFNAMANNTTAYLYYDHSARASDPWKAVQVHTDTIAIDVGGQTIDFNYYKEVGASNNGLSATAGTVTAAIGSTTIAGTSTAFLTHFAAGDLIKLTSASAPGTQQTDAEYGEVAEVISNTSLILKQSLTKTHSGVKVYKQSLKPDFTFDAILGKVEKSNAAAYAAEFYVNSRGRRGPGRWQIPITTLPTNTAQAQAGWDSNWSDRPGNAVIGDQATFFEGTLANFTGTAVWSYDGSIWINQAEIIDGDLIVTGSITTDKIFANAITADKIAANQISADQIAANSITANLIAANQITTSELLANSVTTNTIAANQITTAQIAAGSVKAESVQANSVVANLLAATTISACHITTQSLSSLSANLGAITGGTLRSTGANAPPDANNPPSGNEQGAFLDLTGGKFTFGNSTKNITFDGTNMSLNGVDIDSTSNVNATATPSAVVEDNTVQKANNIGIFNFSTGIDVTVSGTRANMTVNQPYIRSSISGVDSGGLGSFSYNQTTGVASYTGPSASDVRGLLSVATSGDSDLGSLTYDNTQGQYAFAGPTAATIRGKFSGGNGITYTSGTGAIAVSAGSGIAISGGNVIADTTVIRTTGGQSIAGTTTLANVSISGDLTVSGSTTTINTTNLVIEDNKIVVNSSQTGTPASTVTAGIEVERGSSTNKSFVYAESGVGESGNTASGWTFGSERVQAGTFFGTFIGDVTGTPSSLAGLTTDNLAEGTNNLYFTNARARGAVSAGNGISYNSTSGAISANAGSGISVSGSGIAVSGVTTSMIDASSILIGGETFADNDSQLMTAAAVNDRIESFGYTTNTGDITAVTATAGSGLTGTSTTNSGAASFTFNVGATSGGGITVAADSIGVDSSVVRFESNGYINADNWIRIANNTGLYASTGHHFYINSSYGWNSRSSSTSSSSILLQLSNGTQRGWYYADSSANQGFLDTSGAWALQVDNSKNVYAKGNLYATTSNHTVWHAGNDGPGTGLDADLLDNQHGSYYLNYNNFSNTPSIPSVGNGTITISQTGQSDQTFTLNQSGNTTISLTDNNTVPSVGNGTITIQQTGISDQTFTVNQSGNTTISLADTNTDTNTTYTAGTGLTLSGTEFSIAGTGSLITNLLNVNTIVANNIDANAITAEKIATGSITAEELAISNGSSGSAGIYFSTTAMEIHDGTRIRVKIGAL